MSSKQLSQPQPRESHPSVASSNTTPTPTTVTSVPNTKANTSSGGGSGGGGGGGGGANTTNNTTTTTNANNLAMIVVLGMVGTAAGFTMYTKRSTQMLKQLEQISKNRQRRMPPRSIGPMTREEWDQIRPRFDKDEFV